VPLQQGREASALIRTENIIRSDIATELHEVLELYCELLLARITLLDPTNPLPSPSGKAGSGIAPPDPGLVEAVKSLVYAAPRTEIKELQAVRQLLVEKFGKEFAQEAMEERGVSERVLKKLRVEAPATTLVRAYLTEIARTYGVRWPKVAAGVEGDVPPEFEDGADVKGAKGDGKGGDGDDDGDGGGAGEKEEPAVAEELRGASPPRAIDERNVPTVRVAPPSPSSENVAPRVKVPQGQNVDKPKVADGNGSAGVARKSVEPVGGKIPDVDELARRFAALKR